MGGNQHLVFFTPQRLCQLQPDLMGHFRGSLTGRKALVAMIGHRVFLLSKPFLHSHHLIAGGGWAAIHPGNKLLHNGQLLIIHRNLSRFLLLDGILDHIGKTLGRFVIQVLFLVDGWIFRLIRVLHIDDQFPQPAVHPPDGCCSHTFTPWALAGSPPW